LDHIMKIKYIIACAVILGLTGTPALAQKKLPPGLQKNAERGKPLPPGWAKKLAKGEVLDQEIYQHSKIVVPVDSHGLITVNIEGKLVKLYEATREVVEVLK